MKLIVGLGNPGKKYAKTRHDVGFMVLDALARQAKSEKRKVKNYSVKFKTDKQLKSEICEVEIGGKRVVLAKPLTFVNSSGQAVKLLIYDLHRTILFERSRELLDSPAERGRSENNATLAPRNLYIVHDDLDIPLGSFKIQFGKGPKDHKGVESVEKALGTKEFWRVRVGIENREVSRVSRVPKVSKASGEEYVLEEFTKEELKILERVIPEVVEALGKYLIST